MKLWKCSLFLTTVIISASCGKSKDTSSTLANSDPKIVCSVKEVPKDWVIYGHTYASNCPSGRDSMWTFNAYSIKVPTAKREVVCPDSPIPAGYRSVERVRNSSCYVNSRQSLEYKNAVIIEKN